MKITRSRLAAKALPLAPLALAALPFTAHAGVPLPTGIIYTDPADVTASLLYLNMGDPLTPPGAGVVGTSPVSGTDTDFTFQSMGFKGFLGQYATGRSIAAASPYAPISFTTGATIDSGSTFSNGLFGAGSTGPSANPFLALGSPSFLGVRFTDGNSSIHYGWVRISALDRNVTIYDFAYNATPNAPIFAGEGQTAAVPEPSTYSALAGLLAGCAALYHRRQQKKAA